MKSALIIFRKHSLTFCVGLLLATAVNASESVTLLRCNPPTGSQLQEIKIVQINSKIYRSELNSSGSRSALIQMKALAWLKKDLTWHSPDEGRVHLKLIDENGRAKWSYESSGYGLSTVGYCE